MSGRVMSGLDKEICAYSKKIERQGIRRFRMRGVGAEGGKGADLGRSFHGLFFDLFDGVFRDTEIFDAVAANKAFVQLQSEKVGGRGGQVRSCL